MLTKLYPTRLHPLSLQGADSGLPGRWAIFNLKWWLALLKVEKWLHTPISNSSLGSCWNQWSPGVYILSAVVHKPRFPMESLPLMKRKERYKPKGKKPRRLGHNHKKSWSSQGKGNFMWFRRSVILFTVGVYCFSFVPDMFLYSKASALWCQMDKSIPFLLMFPDFPF